MWQLCSQSQQALELCPDAKSIIDYRMVGIEIHFQMESSYPPIKLARTYCVGRIYRWKNMSSARINAPLTSARLSMTNLQPVWKSTLLCMQRMYDEKWASKDKQIHPDWSEMWCSVIGSEMQTGVVLLLHRNWCKINWRLYKDSSGGLMTRTTYINCFM